MRISIDIHWTQIRTDKTLDEVELLMDFHWVDGLNDFSCITDILRSLFSMSEPELLYWCLSLNFDTCADTWFLPDTGGWYNFGNYICHLWWSLISDIDMSSCHPINWSWEIFECFQLWDVKLHVGSWGRQGQRCGSWD